ncbi:hypothetical protein ACA351_04335 [Orientia tsutsugamushi]
MRPVVFDFLTNSCTIFKKNSNNKEENIALSEKNFRPNLKLFSGTYIDI